ncbi:hypothetical protein M501DRAFT_989610 [Patellaria atrata CBS 101060]|uniref:Uncharacterized protein n=1 Tax=Patellaria atrata CBS 101060 TaxID=1346257 RepID=A0A9P4S213_9PEZI|nr:hypothetical protein M501DRAFT_989610 [Patellaria atrata CBS 101060]
MCQCVQAALGYDNDQWKQFLYKKITRDEGDALVFGDDKFWADVGISFENQVSWKTIPPAVKINFIDYVSGILSSKGLTSWNADIAGWRMPKVLQSTKEAIREAELTPTSQESGRRFYDPVRDSSLIPDQAGESSN